MGNRTTPPAPEDAIREALARFRVVGGVGIWKLKTADTELADAALAALDSLVAAKEAAEKKAARNEADFLKMLGASATEYVRAEKAERQRDALAEALREIASVSDDRADDPLYTVSVARAALAALSEPEAVDEGRPAAAAHATGATSGSLSAEEEDAEMWCDRCERRHGVVWFAPSEVWNAVMRGGERGNSDEHSFCCPTCFMQLADERGVGNLMWEVRPEVVAGGGSDAVEAKFSPEGWPLTAEGWREAR